MDWKRCHWFITIDRSWLHRVCCFEVLQVSCLVFSRVLTQKRNRKKRRKRKKDVRRSIFFLLLLILYILHSLFLSLSFFFFLSIFPFCLSLTFFSLVQKKKTRPGDQKTYIKLGEKKDEKENLRENQIEIIKIVPYLFGFLKMRREKVGKVENCSCGGEGEISNSTVSSVLF